MPQGNFQNFDSRKCNVNNPILVSMSQWALGIHHIDNDMIFRFRIVSLELEDRPELNKSYSDRKIVLKRILKANTFQSGRSQLADKRTVCPKMDDFKSSLIFKYIKMGGHG